METTTNVESGDGETESMHTNELSSLQENFNQQQVSVCVRGLAHSANDDPICATVITEYFFFVFFFLGFLGKDFGIERARS